MKERFDIDQQKWTTVTTAEGFLEITALDELDRFVGGFLYAEEQTAEGAARVDAAE